MDILIFFMCLGGMLGMGFLGENEFPFDCYVGARSTSAGHIGLSVVATDVGGNS
jgi:SSS family solute:Na+ symporter